MMKGRAHGLVRLSEVVRKSLFAIAVGSMLFAYGCGSDSQHSSSSAKYPVGVSEDIEQQLKYDARVDSFAPDGEDLIVNVNDTWLLSPSGMRERALGQWYSLWQPAHSSASKIVVRFDGSEVERWTAEKGYQPASKENKNATDG